MEVARRLNEALSKEKLSVKPAGRLTRPSASQLRMFLEQFKGHPSSVEEHHGLLQLACAVVETMEHKYHTSWEQLNSDEKVSVLLYFLLHALLASPSFLPLSSSTCISSLLLSFSLFIFIPSQVLHSITQSSLPPFYKYLSFFQVLLMGADDQQSDSIVKQLQQIISQQLSR